MHRDRGKVNAVIHKLRCPKRESPLLPGVPHPLKRAGRPTYASSMLFAPARDAAAFNTGEGSPCWHGVRECHQQEVAQRGYAACRHCGTLVS
jgi:hypothetical protein